MMQMMESKITTQMKTVILKPEMIIPEVARTVLEIVLEIVLGLMKLIQMALVVPVQALTVPIQKITKVWTHLTVLKIKILRSRKTMKICQQILKLMIVQAQVKVQTVIQLLAVELRAQMTIGS